MAANLISISSSVLNSNGASVFCVDLGSDLGSSLKPRWCNRALISISHFGTNIDESVIQNHEISLGPTWCNTSTLEPRSNWILISSQCEKAVVMLQPVTEANWVQFSAGSPPDFRMWESCRTMPCPFIPALLNTRLNRSHQLSRPRFSPWLHSGYWLLLRALRMHSSEKTPSSLATLHHMPLLETTGSISRQNNRFARKCVPYGCDLTEEVELSTIKKMRVSLVKYPPTPNRLMEIVDQITHAHHYVTAFANTHRTRPLSQLLPEFQVFTGGSGSAAPILADQQAHPADVRRGARQTHPRRSEVGPQLLAHWLLPMRYPTFDNTGFASCSLERRLLARSRPRKEKNQPYKVAGGHGGVEATSLAKANRVRFLAGPLPDYRTWEPGQTMALVGGSTPSCPASFAHPIPALLHTHLKNCHFTVAGPRLYASRCVRSDIDCGTLAAGYTSLPTSLPLSCPNPPANRFYPRPRNPAGLAPSRRAIPLAVISRKFTALATVPSFPASSVVTWAEITKAQRSDAGDLGLKLGRTGTSLRGQYVVEYRQRANELLLIGGAPGGEGGRNGGRHMTENGTMTSPARNINVKKVRKLDAMSAYTRHKAKSKYRTRIRLERASQVQSSDAHETPYDRVKRCRDCNKHIKESERGSACAMPGIRTPEPPAPQIGGASTDCAAGGRPLLKIYLYACCVFFRAVHDKVSTFEINQRTKSLVLSAYISTGAMSDKRPVNFKVSLDRRMNKALKPVVMLTLHKVEEDTKCIQADLKKCFQKRSFYREQHLPVIRTLPRQPLFNNGGYRSLLEKICIRKGRVSNAIFARLRQVKFVTLPGLPQGRPCGNLLRDSRLNQRRETAMLISAYIHDVLLPKSHTQKEPAPKEISDIDPRDISCVRIQRGDEPTERRVAARVTSGSEVCDCEHRARDPCPHSSGVELPTCSLGVVDSPCPGVSAADFPVRLGHREIWRIRGTNEPEEMQIFSEYSAGVCTLLHVALAAKMHSSRGEIQSVYGPDAAGRKSNHTASPEVHTVSRAHDVSDVKFPYKRAYTAVPGDRLPRASPQPTTTPFDLPSAKPHPLFSILAVKGNNSFGEHRVQFAPTPLTNPLIANLTPLACNTTSTKVSARAWSNSPARLAG
ncbi:hypothetical protein PR048_023998 [Dryococelus australis]|uniref:Uncharacterized protein n=1 Tax=Dryococelus australis TaxID=614101 RepID=A0ABQ9GVP6_9NEOP|nr:hypothetical protein PR048_023998 [Dryococelus australis]